MWLSFIPMHNPDITIQVHPNNIRAVESMGSNFTTIHFDDYSNFIVAIPIDQVKRDKESS